MSDKVLWVKPGMYYAIRAYMRDHEHEYGEETATMAFLQLGIPEQPIGTNVRVIVDETMANEFCIVDDVGQNLPTQTPSG